MESEVAVTFEATTTTRQAETPATVSTPKKRGRNPKINGESQSPYSLQQSNTEKKRKNHKPIVDDKYPQWKTLVPILYDSIANHNLVWPSLSCRSGFLVLFMFF